MTQVKEPNKPLSISDLEKQYQRELAAWSEAHSIPSGCGCTPFYADARNESRQTIRLYKALAEESPAQAKLFAKKHPHWSGGATEP